MFYVQLAAFENSHLFVENPETIIWDLTYTRIYTIILNCTNLMFAALEFFLNFKILETQFTAIGLVIKNL
jgi:hypothetical protein